VRLGIAGYGNIGRYLESVFAPYFDVELYDPPLGIGSGAGMDACDFVFIAVPTPSGPGGAADTSAVEQVVATLSPRHGFICHSTVPVGTTERLVATYGKPVVFVPEYAGERPDHPYRNVENRTFFIFGGKPAATARVEPLFARAYGADCAFAHVPARTAELVKYMENAYLALKVTFCNEFFDLAGALGVDFEVARTLWLQDRRVGESHTVVTAERGYGGLCLPKDVRAICATAQDAGAPLELMEAAARVNERVRRGATVAVTAAR
jgi:UDPglucose 6-dehydrogenase